MRCDDFLPLVATGGRFGRWRARRHARLCARCAAAARMMSELKGERSPSSPLPTHLRHRWQAVVPAEYRESATRRARSHARRRWMVAAAAISAFVLLVLPPLADRRWKVAPPVARQAAPDKSRPGPGQPRLDTKRAAPTKRAPGEIALTVIDPDEQLAWLEQRVVQLAGEVEQVAEASQKLAVEQEIGELLKRHADW